MSSRKTTLIPYFCLMVILMRKLLLLSFLCVSAFISQAQKPTEKLYALDSLFKGTDVKTAKYLLRIRNYADTLWQWDTYRMWGPMLSSGFFKDANGEMAHGEFRYFGADGNVDSILEFKNGIASGSWYYYNDTGAIYLEKVFQNGVLKETLDLEQRKNRQLEILADTSRVPVFSRVERESEFPGGRAGWAAYLQKNLKYPDRAISAEIQGIAVVRFIVDKEGKILDPHIIHSVEFSIDNAALDIIRKSPLWVPAEQNGRRVKSYKAQPIHFRLQ